MAIELQPHIDTAKSALNASSSMMLQHIDNVNNGVTNAQGQKMYSPQEFAGIVRSKYPGAYDNVPDTTLVSKFLEKYPAYQSRVSQHQSIEDLQAKAKSAQAEADKSSNPFVIAGRTVIGAAKDIIGQVPKFIKSAVNVPLNLYQGATGQEMTTMSGDDGVTTYQQDFQNKTLPAVESGQESPLGATARTVGEVVSGGADVLGAETLAEKGIKTAEKLASPFIDKSLATNASKEALKVVTPELTAKETEQALSEGRGKTSKILGKTTIQPNKRLTDVAKSVEGVVSKSNTGAQNISNIKTALGKEADTLAKSIENVKQPVSDKGVKTFLDNVEKPIEIEADATQSRKFDITKNALTRIIAKNEKTVSGLLKSRKEFDALVSKEFPNLYDRANAPWRSAVTGMRNALNDAIEANLPDGFGYKESLRKQSLMYEAIDNIAGSSGEEIGTNRFTRFGQRHPIITKTVKVAGGSVVAGTLGGGAYEGTKKILGQ